MGTKRPFADVDAQETGDGAREKRRMKHSGRTKHRAKEGTSEFSSKRARSIARLLQRNQDLPANVRNDLERELAALQADVADRAFHRRRSAMISKYHMVRFFERRKASRLVKQLKRQMERNPESEDMDSLKQDLHVAEVDEAYTLYYPYVEPYVSIYGKAQPGEGDDDDGSRTPAAKTSLKAERPPMWSVVERTMQEGPEALARLRERRPADDKPKRKPKRQPSKVPAEAPSKVPAEAPDVGHKQKQGGAGSTAAQPQLNRKQRRQLMRQSMPAPDDADGDGDGGFFEDM